MDFPDDLRYAKSHEWARDNGDGTVTVGISDFAQDELGDIVFVELPEVGAELEAGEEFGTVESVKAASAVYSPVSGEVIEVNSDLEDSPELINEDPYEEGWLMTVRMAEPDDLKRLWSAEQYEAAADAGDFDEE
ncbi:MAG: glycine cleavage system protein GcvH [Deinococcales bacterium]